MQQRMNEAYRALKVFHNISGTKNQKITVQELQNAIEKSIHPDRQMTINSKLTKAQVVAQQQQIAFNSAYKHQKVPEWMQAQDFIDVMCDKDTKQHVDFVDFYTFYRQTAMESQYHDRQMILQVLTHITGRGQITFRDLTFVMNRSGFPIKEDDLRLFFAKMSGDDTKEIITVDDLMQVIKLYTQ